MMGLLSLAVIVFGFLLYSLISGRLQGTVVTAPMVFIIFGFAVGSGLSLPSHLFLGWFGPRGLASILFVLLILEESDTPHREELLSVTVITVALSALLHGISAAPLASLYGRFTNRMGECQENRPAAELPLREGHIGNKSDP